MIHLDTSKATGQAQFDGSHAKSEASKETTLFHKAVNATSTDFYRQMSRNSENKNFIFFTPTLLASLSMLYAGAPDELKTVMEQELHMGEVKEEKWHIQFQDWSEDIQHRSLPVLSMLKANQVGFRFHQIQIIASQQSTPLTDQARHNLVHYDPTKLVFTDPEEVCSLINAVVYQATEGKITDLIEQVSPKLALIMASAALFKGEWKYPFDKNENSKEMFANGDGTIVSVEMMNKGIDNLRTAYDYNEDVDAAMEILELPFHGDISLLLLNPSYADAQNCASVLQNYMTENNMQSLLNNYEERFKKTKGLTIGVPKLTLQEKTDFLEAFKETPLAQKILSANFSGSLLETSRPTQTPELISEVNFTMDEEGVTMAAASYSPTYRDSCDPEFKLNKPFGLAIIDRTTQTILGMGQVLKMAGEKIEEIE